MNKIGLWLFRNRSYTPIPFLILLLALATPSPLSLVAGILVVLLGEGIRVISVAHAGLETRATTQVGAPRLVTSGPYSHVRNPLYVGNIVMYVGFGIMSGIGWMPILALLWFGFQYAMIVSTEEAYLRERFGAEYEEFTTNVPAFIPRLTPWKEHRKDIKPDFGMAMKSERRSFQSVSVAVLLVVAVSVWRQMR